MAIVEGEEYGTMLYFDPYKIESNSFSNIDEGTYNLIYFYANGIEPEDTGKVKIHISTTDPNIPETDVNIKIIPNQNYPIRLTFIPAVLAPGDTADIQLEKRYGEYPFSDPETVTYELFPADQLFNVKIEKGEQYGTILNPAASDTSDEFLEIEQGFKFLAIDSINTDTAKISIRISTIEDNGGLIASSIKRNDFSDPQITKSIKELDRKKRSSSTKNNWEEEERKNNKSIKEITNSIIPNSIVPPSSGGELIFGIGHISIVSEENEIMLGETKYYAVKKKTETGELKIEDIPTVYGEEPKFPADENGWVWQKTDVWGSEPIERLGTKSGVYWEKKWFRSSDNSSQSLADGMIRLVGRFWELGKEDSFKVKIKTINNDKIEIKVVNPSRLGNKYNNSKDVFNKPISIDSLCIKYGGESGIPPQFIKGQIENEAPGFFPPYRYEPLSTELNNRNNNGEIVSKKWKNSPFFVTENSMGSGGDVPTHYNLKYISYFTTPTKVWDILKKYSQIEDDNPSGNITLFCKKENGKLNFKKYGYKTAQKEYDKILMHFQGVKSNPAEKDYIAARDSTIKYFKYYWYGGLDSMYAQTRIFASYGLLQTMYETALNRGYKNDSSNLPENLSINDIAWPLTIKHLSKLLSEVLEENNNIWVFGYENIFKAMAKKWNPWMTNYDLDALNNSKKYLPTNKN